MNIDEHLLGVLVDAVREGVPDALVSSVPAIIVYARKGDAFTTVEIDVMMLTLFYVSGGVDGVRQHMLELAKGHAIALDRLIAEEQA